MPEIHNNHSEEVQELLGKIPGWIIRWGLTMVFLIFFLIILGSYFISYPEVVRAPLVITTYNTPVILNAKSGGKIQRIFVEDEQRVYTGQRVALIENTARYEHIQVIEDFIGQLVNPIEWERTVLDTHFNDTLFLGELNNQYAIFQKNMKQFRNYLLQNHMPLKLQLLDEQISMYQEIYKNQLQQLALQANDLKLSSNKYKRDSLLFDMGNATINDADYDNSLQAYLQKQVAYKDFEYNNRYNEVNLLKLKESRIDLELQYEKELQQFNLELNEDLQLLQSAIEHWKQQYLIESPIDGLITFTSYWSQNQVIKMGERMATVVPLDETRIVAKATIPRGNFGKIEKGQKVNIKLSGFPYTKFGVLRGKISAVSLVPEELGYVVQIELIGGMTSSYSQELKFIQEMDGTAEITTKKMRLIYRLIDPLRVLVDRISGLN